jgi:2-polyprenyl-3-methyl-5-hydroxy-6-metoxy-1,4-benzoquinol methylase
MRSGIAGTIVPCSMVCDRYGVRRVTADVAAADEGLARFYRSKQSGYFSGARADLIARLPADPTARVLEIGCGTGATGALALARGRAGTYTGVELFESAAAEARPHLTEVIVGDVERLQFDWAPCAFDALIMSEVLEHLIDPWALLKRLRAFVRPGATVLASSPNISHWRVVRELIHGRFPLADQGVFDRTHMRWFTPASYIAMFEQSGYAVTSIMPVTPFSARTQMISRLTDGRYDHLFMTQICLEARRV